MEIQVQVKSVYGVEKVYPVCKAAQLFAQIAKSKTLTKDTLVDIFLLGYEIKVNNKPIPLSDLIAFK